MSADPGALHLSEMKGNSMFSQKSNATNHNLIKSVLFYHLGIHEHSVVAGVFFDLSSTHDSSEVAGAPVGMGVERKSNGEEIGIEQRSLSGQPPAQLYRPRHVSQLGKREVTRLERADSLRVIMQDLRILPLGLVDEVCEFAVKKPILFSANPQNFARARPAFLAPPAATSPAQPGTAPAPLAVERPAVESNAPTASVVRSASPL